MITASLIKFNNIRIVNLYLEGGMNDYGRLINFNNIRIINQYLEGGLSVIATGLIKFINARIINR